jgi:hypothetical protein
MRRVIIEAFLSACTGVLLFTALWCWYYVTDGWRSYQLRVRQHQSAFFSWHYRLTVIMIFVGVFLVVEKLAHH